MYYFLQLPIRRYGYTSNEPELYSFTVQHRADLWPLRTICTNCFIYVYITTNCFIYVYITTNCFIYVNITTNCFIYVYITTNCFIYVNKLWQLMSYDAFSLLSIWCPIYVSMARGRTCTHSNVLHYCMYVNIFEFIIFQTDYQVQ